MELDIFARVYAKAGQEDTLAAVLVAHLEEVRSTPGCMVIHDYRSVRDPRLLYIHSRWVDQAAFETYARLPTTERFANEAEERMDNPPLQPMRATAIASVPSIAEARGDLYVFAPFHARPGSEDAVEQALREVHGPTMSEPSCVLHQIYRSVRNARLYYVHSVWKTEAAFDEHAERPHTLRFIERIEKLIDHPLQVTRAREIG